MDTSVLDTCGLSCPQPVLMLHEAVKAGKKSLDILVDNEASRENVTRAAQKYGFAVTEHEQAGGVRRLELRA